MAINFPNSPSVNDTFNSGTNVYVWDGTVWSVDAGTNASATNVMDTPPSNPVPGQLWWRSSNGLLYVY